MVRTVPLLALALAPAAARAQFVIDYETNTFCSNQGGISLVSGASFSGGGPCELEVAGETNYDGAAWYTTAFDPSLYDRVETRFVLDISGGDLGTNGWDGMTFTLQAVGTTALGGYLDLAYGGISPSVAVEFDTWDSGGFDPSNNHVGVDTNGSLTSLVTATPAWDLNSNTLAYVWVDFDIAAQTMDVYVASTNARPASPTMSQGSIDLTALGSAVYAGFTGASGTYWTGYANRTGNDHIVQSWYLEAFETDSDGDGVPNDLDVCPGFDDNLDADADTVPDGCDVCNGFDDRLDGDGDGTPDGCDSCPADPLDDSDGDGSCDSDDLCPGFDDTIDADIDTIPDLCDACPGFDDLDDPDFDGVPTGCDACPLDFPDDTDGDGLCDSDDPCPLDFPDDTDGDTVCDSDDVCPGYDDTIDLDGDGWIDCTDPCPGDPYQTCITPGQHLSEPFYPQADQGQWCDSDAPAHWYYWGEMGFEECENHINGSGTQWFVGIWTTYTQGWIGGQDDVNANVTSAVDWTNEVLVAKTSLYSCVSAQIEHRTAPTVYPIEQIYFDAATGRTWHYWDLVNQTHSQAISFADDRFARIINPSQVGQPGLARMTAPTHWCHAGAEFNGPNNCNSDNICSFMVGYFE